MTMPSLPFNRQDLMTIRWPLLSLVVSIIIACSAIIWIDGLRDRSGTLLQSAQQNLRQTRQSIAELEAEMAAFRRYEDQYGLLQERELITAEDRIGLLEEVARIREAHQLFPVNVSIGEQDSMPLEYPPAEPYPGGPVELHFSRIDLSLSLLHEGDLLNLLQSLHDTPGLFQTQGCRLLRSGNMERGYERLAQHFSAGCTLLWYTFALPDEGNGATP